MYSLLWAIVSCYVMGPYEQIPTAAMYPKCALPKSNIQDHPRCTKSSVSVLLSSLVVGQTNQPEQLPVFVEQEVDGSCLTFSSLVIFQLKIAFLGFSGKGNKRLLAMSSWTSSTAAEQEMANQLLRRKLHTRKARLQQPVFKDIQGGS